MLARRRLNGLPTLKRLRQQIHHAPQALELTHVLVQVQQLSLPGGLSR